MCAWKGPSLVVTETANLQGAELTDRLTFTASDDRKTMTMDSHITSATINGDRKLVYDAADSSAATSAQRDGSDAGRGSHDPHGRRGVSEPYWNLEAEFGQKQLWSNAWASEPDRYD